MYKINHYISDGRKRIKSAANDYLSDIPDRSPPRPTLNTDLSYNGIKNRLTKSPSKLQTQQRETESVVCVCTE